MKSSNASTKPSLHSEALMRVRMAMPSLTLADSLPLPDTQAGAAQVYIQQLLDLGFIYSHEILIDNPIGKQEGEISSVFVYMNVDQNVYALLTDLFHQDAWVYFTNYYTRGQRLVTTSQPGSLQLEPLQNNTDFDDLFIQNAGSGSLGSLWKRHRRLAATWLPNENPLVLQPEQHLLIERGFYLRYVQHLMQSNILRQSDTQTFRFTRSGARAFHAAITSRSARRPQPKVEDWISKRGKFPLQSLLHNRKTMVGLGVAAAIAGVVAIFPQLQSTPAYQPDISNPGVSNPTVSNSGVSNSGVSNPDISNKIELHKQSDQASSVDDIASAGDNQEAMDDVSLATVTATVTTAAPIDTFTTDVDVDNNAALPKPSATIKTQDPAPTTGNAQTVQLIAASTEDEMWRIAVENAEFYLMSNDGDPAPWIRTARKIAAGFRSNDERLARTYFLAALLESDYRIAEQQYNRALSIQTKSLGLYHAETAQTLEALAWIAERNKDSLEEAITHQKLALNIYRDIYGADAEDTKAAQWKLEYFEDRLAGKKPRIDENRRLLPALARFGN